MMSLTTPFFIWSVQFLNLFCLPCTRTEWTEWLLEHAIIFIGVVFKERLTFCILFLFLVSGGKQEWKKRYNKGKTKPRNWNNSNGVIIHETYSPVCNLLVLFHFLLLLHQRYLLYPSHSKRSPKLDEKEYLVWIITITTEAIRPVLRKINKIKKIIIIGE